MEAGYGKKLISSLYMSDMKNHPVTSLTYPLKASSHRKIAVIGGGIAGMEAASTAAECGHTVELFERQSSLGGGNDPIWRM